MERTLRTTLAAVAAAAALFGSHGEARAAVLSTLSLDSQALTVRGAKGYVVLSGQAAVLGRAWNGLLIVTESEGRCEDVAVFGAEWRATTTERRIFRGRDLRFRVVSDGCRFELAGRDLDISAVVRGFASVKGTDGLVKVNGGVWRPLPDAWATYRLGADPPERARPTARSLLRLEIRWMRAIGMGWSRIKDTEVWARFVALG